MTAVVILIFLSYCRLLLWLIMKSSSCICRKKYRFLLNQGRGGFRRGAVVKSTVSTNFPYFLFTLLKPAPNFACHTKWPYNEKTASPFSCIIEGPCLFIDRGKSFEISSARTDDTKPTRQHATYCSLQRRSQL